MRVAIPDLVSNSYFPAIAAVELGFFQAEGLDATLELLFPVPKTMEALRDGALDFVAGAAHAPLMAFPDWKGAKLLAALAQRTYWFLILRSDLNVQHGDVQAVKGLRIGAAPGVDNRNLSRSMASCAPPVRHPRRSPSPPSQAVPRCGGRPAGRGWPRIPRTRATSMARCSSPCRACSTSAFSAR